MFLGVLGVLGVFWGGVLGHILVFLDVSKKFHVAWPSSQLPEQKEGLFYKK